MYASPEQIRGDPLTTATDVYSLGVVLYEMLTGARPHRARERIPHDLERAVCEDDPEKPSTTAAHVMASSRDGRRARLAGDLDAIVLTALRKEPEARYASAEQLSEDLRRFLEGLPVQARRSTLRYRAAKLLKRHRAAVLAAMIVRQALDVRHRLLGENSRESADTLNDLGVLLKTKGDLEAAEALLRRATSIRRGVVAGDAPDTANDPALPRKGRVDLATSLTNLAAVVKNRGAYDEAERLYAQALEIFRTALGERHYRVAVCLNDRALLLMEVGRYHEAELLFREALDIRRAVFGAQHLAVATGLKNLALLLATTGRYQEAEPLYREALALGRRLPGNEQLLANTLNNLADLPRHSGA
jgi:serine/threonine-protein kinase